MAHIMEHVGNIIDAVLGGIVLLALIPLANYLLKVTKTSGVTRTLIRFVSSGVLLAMWAFCIFAAYVIQHERGFNNGVVFVIYLISILGYGLTFILFNSNWIGSYADKTASTWNHFRDLASPNYTPIIIPTTDAPLLEQIIARLEEVDHHSVELYVAAERLQQIGTQAVEPLIGALSHHRANVRQNAAYALGKIKDDRAIKPLIEAFNMSSMTMATAQALAEYGQPALQPLSEASRSTNQKIREGAIMTLGWSHNLRSVEELDKLFEEWITGRQLEGEELFKTCENMLDEYWLPPAADMASEERKELMTKRADAMSKWRKQFSDYDDHQKWWLGRTVVQSFSSLATTTLKRLPK